MRGWGWGGVGAPPRGMGRWVRPQEGACNPACECPRPASHRPSQPPASASPRTLLHEGPLRTPSATACVPGGRVPSPGDRTPPPPLRPAASRPRAGWAVGIFHGPHRPSRPFPVPLAPPPGPGAPVRGAGRAAGAPVRPARRQVDASPQLLPEGVQGQPALAALPGRCVPGAVGNRGAGRRAAGPGRGPEGPCCAHRRLVLLQPRELRLPVQHAAAPHELQGLAAYAHRWGAPCPPAPRGLPSPPPAPPAPPAPPLTPKGRVHALSPRLLLPRGMPRAHGGGGAQGHGHPRIQQRLEWGEVEGHIQGSHTGWASWPGGPLFSHSPSHLVGTK